MASFKHALWKALRWLGGGLLALLLIGSATIYIMSERVISAEYQADGQGLELPSDAAALGMGEKIARTRGCVGCHGADGGGRYMVNDWKLAVLAAPNLTKLVHERSVAELDRSIRQGIREDGTSVLVMPSSMFHQIADAELAAAIAWLRTLPVVDKEFDGRSFGPLARIGLAMGEFKTERAQFEAYPAVAPAPDDPVAHGKYLVYTTCTECHGADLAGSDLGAAPDLVVAAAYSPDSFQVLMREGVSQGGQELGLMKAVALGRFSHFSEEELEAIHAFLRSPAFLESRH